MYGVAATASLTLEEVFDMIEARLGLRRDELLAARAGAILFGGRHSRTEDIERAEEFRHEVELRLRERYGWIRTILGWYGLRYTTRAYSRRPSPPVAEAEPTS